MSSAHSKRRRHSEFLRIRGSEGLTSSLRTLAEHGGGLVATDTSTPLAALLLVLVGAVVTIRRE